MRLLCINESIYGSTGRLMEMIARKSGMQYLLAVSSSRSNKRYKKENVIYIGTRFGRNVHLLLGKLLGLNGMLSVIDTLFFIKRVKKFSPDIIHLHNLHNCYINLPVLFRFLSKTKATIVWTLHDCWSFTGHCPHFISIGCEKWKTGCHGCPLHKQYPRSLVDDSKRMWIKKKKWFNLPSSIHFVTPSMWLKTMFSSSFLNRFSCTVINNGIDLSAFRYRGDGFRKSLNIKPDEYLVLGVSFEWTRKKGLDVFLRLRTMLGENYRFLLIGRVGEGLILPNSIQNIGHVDGQDQLSLIYSSADVFVNPTREDTFPTVNMEASACSLPIVTFDVGGCKETINHGDYAVPCGDVEEMARKIIEVCSGARIRGNFDQSRQHDINACVSSYLRLYNGE